MSITTKTFEAAIRKRQKTPDAFRPITLRDSQVPGLALYVGKTAETWRFQYKPRGKTPDGKRHPTRTLMLGDHAELSLEEARAEAVAAKADVRGGGDPFDEKRRTAALRISERRTRRTCGNLIPDFIADYTRRDSPHRPGKKISAHHVSAIDRELHAALEAMGAEDLTPDEVTAKAVARHFRNRSGTKWQIQYLALRKFLAFAVEEDLVEFNVAAMVQRPKAGTSRQRVLTAEELRELWHAVGTLAPTRRDLVRFLIAVPCRSGEAVHMRWADLDDDLTVWTQDGTATKNGQPHEFAIPDIAREILADRPRDSEFVFPSRDGLPIRGRSSLNDKIHAATPDIEDWTLHDLRRTCVSHLGEAQTGFAESVIDRVLNHKASSTTGGVLGVYQRAERRKEQAAVMHTWGSILSEIVNPGSTPSNVVGIRQ